MAPLKNQEDFRKSRKFLTVRKKLEELSTLCDVPAFLLCFEHSNYIRSYSWPENQSNFSSLIHEYQRCLDEEQSKNCKRKRTSDSTTTSIPSSSSKKINKGFLRNEGSGSDELPEIFGRIDRNRKAVEERIQVLKLNQSLNEEKSYQEKHSDLATTIEINGDSNESNGLWESIFLQSRVLAESSRRLCVAEEAMNKTVQDEFSDLGFLDEVGFSLEELGFF